MARGKEVYPGKTQEKHKFKIGDISWLESGGPIRTKAGVMLGRGGTTMAFRGKVGTRLREKAK